MERSLEEREREREIERSIDINNVKRLEKKKSERTQHSEMMKHFRESNMKWNGERGRDVHLLWNSSCPFWKRILRTLLQRSFFFGFGFKDQDSSSSLLF